MKTRLVFNKLIPFNGFLAMTLWPFIFVREELAKMYSTVVNNHEHIHAEQQKEMLIVGFALALIGFVFGLGWCPGTDRLCVRFGLVGITFCPYLLMVVFPGMAN